MFPIIAAATTSKQAWNILKTEFQGSSRVISVKLQLLRRELETSQMKGSEAVQEFVSRIMNIINQMRTYGDLIEDHTVVAKILRSLTPKFDYVVAAIEESRDLATLSIDELSGSLQAHEARIVRSEGKAEENALQANVERDRAGNMHFPREAADERDFRGQQWRGRGRSSYRGRARGRTRGGFTERRGAYRSSVQCHNCKRYGHVKAQCWLEGKEANLVEGEEEVSDLFVVHDAGVEQGSVWIIDSGCSNHMTGDKALLRIE